MKNLLILCLLIFVAASCGDKSTKSEDKTPKKEEKSTDDGKGIGETKNVELNNPLDQSMVDLGKSIYEMKCAACHKLTDQRVVGPGWAGITEKRKPEWIMNMTTNVEVMLEKDPEARELLKECLVRMPNQNLTTKDARDVLEFMYANDGKNQ
jgi:cytochrome c